MNNNKDNETIFEEIKLKGKLVFQNKSEFQSVDILDSSNFGRVLLIDNLTQSTEKDERMYHECLVQPALLVHPNPKRIFIAGGGEGATAREILRFNSVEELVMVDIDTLVIETSKKYLPNHHQNCWEDKRMKLIIQDAKKYLYESTEKFDVIFLDLPEPSPDGPCYDLYTKTFFEKAKERLNDGGILVSQTGSACHIDAKQVYAPIQRTIKEVFAYIENYATFMPSFFMPWGYTIAFKNKPERILGDYLPSEIDKLMQQKLKGENEYYDGITHRHIFSVPKNLRKILDEEDLILTEETKSLYAKRWETKYF